ncbi:MAG: integration host factor subunit beta [Candidatus Binatia bacterium]|nr:MAG: integration host factor subunit beta [Candidatus Binatia bacterium]
MTKRELVEELGRRFPYCSRRDLETVVHTVFRSMVEALQNDDRVEIRGFGTFQLRERQGRKTRNPKTGELLQIAPKRMPFFRAGKELRLRVDAQKPNKP